MRTMGSASSGTTRKSTGYGWAHSKRCSAVKSVARFIIIVSFAAEVVQTALSQEQGEMDKPITAILADWDALPTVFDDIDIYARQIRQLAEIGKPAVPALTAALDKTSRDTEMRLLAFALRAIGDPRAVPALIRAIPKTLLPPGSDCGMSVSDREVLTFMQSNDLEAQTGEHRGRGGFGMGRPVREICIALQRITGTHQNESNIFSTFLQGGEQQRQLARQAFYEVARRWADWWNNNWNQFVDDPSLAEVKLSAPSETPGPKRFLTGPNVKTTGGREGVIVGPIEEHASNSSLTLSVNRFNLGPETSNAAPASLENITVWAARAGADVLGTQYRDPQSGKLYYGLRSVSLQAWEIPNEHWANIEEDLQKESLPSLKAPAGDLLMHYDAAQARYAPEKKATFLFITRDGNQGILRLTAQVTRRSTPPIGMPYIRMDNDGPDQASDAGPELGVKVDYKFFYRQTEEMKAEDNAQREAVAARKQVRERRRMAEALANYPHLSGTVYLPNGQTASNATVMLGLAGETAFLGDRRFEFTNQAMLVHTPADGRFVLPKVPKARALYVVHAAGYGEIEVEDAEPPLAVRLERWGRIEGTLIIAGKLAPHEKMAILNPPLPRGSGGLNLYLGTFRTESDDQGRFVFPYIPSREVQICRVIRNTFCQGQFVKVKAGEITIYQHGFNGRAVKGHFVTSDQSGQIEWKAQGFTFSTKAFPPEAPMGEDPDAWTEMYWQSAEGKERLRGIHHFVPIVEANGDFRIDDVPAGTYLLRGELYEGAGSSVFARGKSLGHLNQEVTVPERQPNQSIDPLDLGNVVIQMVKTLKPGDLAPDFEVKTVDGKILRLADFRGKYVLLDFWATWCAPCRAETPNLKDVYDTFGGNPRFAMIGLSLDRTVDAPINYARKEGLPWYQGFLGEARTKLPGDYGVEGVPATFLLDPAGKVIATELRGTNVAAAVSAALGKP